MCRSERLLSGKVLERSSVKDARGEGFWAFLLSRPYEKAHECSSPPLERAVSSQEQLTVRAFSSQEQFTV